MADILIRGMEMPETCDECPMYTCMHNRRDCPLIELPEHGDLIDRDVFREENEYYLNREFINPKYEDTLDDLLKDAPVVVPANKEETE